MGETAQLEHSVCVWKRMGRGPHRVQVRTGGLESLAEGLGLYPLDRSTVMRKRSFYSVMEVRCPLFPRSRA